MIWQKLHKIEMQYESKLRVNTQFKRSLEISLAAAYYIIIVLVLIYELSQIYIV